MGLCIHKQVRLGKRARLNISGSGVSISLKKGPFTINSREGRVTVRLGNGVAYRTSLKKIAKFLGG